MSPGNRWLIVFFLTDVSHSSINKFSLITTGIPFRKADMLRYGFTRLSTWRRKKYNYSDFYETIKERDVDLLKDLVPDKYEK